MFDLLQMLLSLGPKLVWKGSYLRTARNLPRLKGVAPMYGAAAGRSFAVGEVDRFEGQLKRHFTKPTAKETSCNLKRLALMALQIRLVPVPLCALPL